MKRSILQMTRTSKGRKQLRPSLQVQVPEVDSRVEMIQALIPLGLRAVQEQLQQTVTEMAGARYAHDGGDVVRWGQQKGWVYLADQKVQTDVPRVRNCRLRREVPLPLYQQLQQPRLADSLAMSKVLKGLSCRDYESCVPATVETFGLSASSLSRRFKRVTARQLGQLQERDLSGYDFVALFLDGKSFAEDQMVIALGVTLRGEKVILGFVQTATENQTTCTAFLRSLVERGLRYDEGLLLVIDGAKGYTGRREKCVRRLRSGAALPVAQTGERGELSPQGLAADVPAKAATGLSATHVRSRQGRVAEGANGTAEAQSIGGSQFG